MFTVKVRESEALGANEYLYSAERIEVVWPGPARSAANGAPAVEGATNIYEAGIFLDPHHEPVSEEEGHSPSIRMASHVILFGHEATSSGELRKGGKVWVMNEHGATVATYDL